MESIIAGPTTQCANWLGESEFTVDLRKLVEVERLWTFASRLS
jgi:hypothetical protein